jgi:hypothetical protein
MQRQKRIKLYVSVRFFEIDFVLSLEPLNANLPNKKFEGKAVVQKSGFLGAYTRARPYRCGHCPQ